MKKIKIKKRIENAADAFFAGESLFENDALTFANESSFRRKELSAEFSAKADFAFSIFKQVFLFFPGTFVLFIISFGFSVISVNNRFNATIPPGRVGWVIFWFLMSVLMTWVGIGDIRKPKHLVIPFSIIATGAVLGAASAILSAGYYELQKIVWSNAYPLYFFSVALIVPFLAKGLVDREARKPEIV